jgi:hypothetical protein
MRGLKTKRAINGTLELDGARLVWQLASEQGWIRTVDPNHCFESYKSMT